MGQNITTLKRRLQPRKGGNRDAKPDSKKLAAQLRPLYTELLRDLGYTTAPTVSDERAGEVLAVMYKKAVAFGVPLDTPLSAKGFRLGFSEGVVSRTRILNSSSRSVTRLEA